MTTETFENSRLAKDFSLVSKIAGDRYLAAAKAPSTWRRYAYVVKQFEAWCADRGLCALPALNSTVQAWIIWLADQDYAYNTVAAYYAAISAQHSAAGYSVDRRPLSDRFKGMRALAARPRRARPMLSEELRGILAMLNPDDTRDVRDGAMLAVGFGAALRRSELVGLDWHRHKRSGGGTGVLRLTHEGVHIELIEDKTMRRRSMRSMFKEIPVSGMPAAHYWLTLLASHLSPGEPAFRPVTKAGTMLPSRIGSDRVTKIIRARAVALEIAKGIPAEEALRQADGYTGHSLRRGYITSAARAGVPFDEILPRSGHADANQLVPYIEEANARKNHGLKGVGF